MPASPPITHRSGRPPADTARYNETRTLLLRAGHQMLTEKGFSTVGRDKILRLVSIPKGSCYHYFKSMDDFGRVLIVLYYTYFAHCLLQAKAAKQIPYNSDCKMLWELSGLAWWQQSYAPNSNTVLMPCMHSVNFTSAH